MLGENLRYGSFVEEEGLSDRQGYYVRNVPTAEASVPLPLTGRKEEPQQDSKPRLLFFSRYGRFVVFSSCSN